MPPLVSVVVATYNRSAVLRHALRSVLDSTVADLEVVVVGDRCTDDTDAVVAALGDPRLRFVNLPENCGDQSGPSNHALSLATGRYLAFLNQDDLFFPDHLEAAIAHLQASGADFVWTPTLVVEPAGEEALARGEWRVTVGSTPPGDAFDPLTFCVASSWVLDRRLVARIGPWRHPSQLYVTPSQDWIYRASRCGAVLTFLPRPGVLVVYSGSRPASYARRGSPEHDACAPRLREPGFREALLSVAAVSQAADWNAAAQGRMTRRLARTLAAPLRAACVGLGLHPLSAHLLLRLHRRGTLIARHRSLTGAGTPPTA
jgi:glycosyltransferase involved in cell wall biosynthesis